MKRNPKKRIPEKPEDGKPQAVAASEWAAVRLFVLDLLITRLLERTCAVLLQRLSPEYGVRMMLFKPPSLSFLLETQEKGDVLCGVVLDQGGFRFGCRPAKERPALKGKVADLLADTLRKAMPLYAERVKALSHTPLGANVIAAGKVDAPDGVKETAAQTLAESIWRGTYPVRKHEVVKELERDGRSLNPVLQSVAWEVGFNVPPPDEAVTTFIPLRKLTDQEIEASKADAARQAEALERHWKSVRKEGEKALEREATGGRTLNSKREKAFTSLKSDSTQDDETQELPLGKPLGVGEYILQNRLVELEELAALEQAVFKDDTDRRIFHLRKQGQTQQAIAKELGMSQPAVSKRVAKMRERLERWRR